MIHHSPVAQSFSNSKPPLAEKPSKDHPRNKSEESSTTSVYQAKVADLSCKVNVTWCKSLIDHSLSIHVENPSAENHHTCKIDLDILHFWNKKGLKSFEIDEKRVDFFWDFREVKFSNSPEPCSDYYLAMVSNKEVVLLLGDLKNEAYKRTNSKPSLEEATLVYKKENVYGKRLFCTKAKLGEGKKEHDIVIENAVSGFGDPEMWISADGIVLIRVMKLHWRFRGNETVFLNNLPIQIFWDVHDWLFNSPSSGHALFIFKPGAPEYSPDSDLDGTNRSGEAVGSDIYDSLWTTTSAADFCHFLYARQID